MLRVDVCRYDDTRTHGFFPVADTRDLLAEHVWVAWAAGFWYGRETAQGPAFAPGELLTLVPDPDNEWDPHAIGVWDRDQIVRAAWIPARFAESLEPVHRDAVALLEALDDDGQRIALLIVVAREPIELVVGDGPPSGHSMAMIQRSLRHIYEYQPPVPQLDPIEAMRRMVEDIDRSATPDPP